MPAVGRRGAASSARAAEASGVQDQKSTNDKVAMGVGLIIFWPALLFTKGNDGDFDMDRSMGFIQALTYLTENT